MKLILSLFASIPFIKDTVTDASCCSSEYRTEISHPLPIHHADFISFGVTNPPALPSL